MAMAMDDSDSNVIDINSDDGLDGYYSSNCCVVKNAIHNKTTKKNGNDSSMLSSAASAQPGEAHDQSQSKTGGKHLGQTKGNVSIVHLDACSNLDIISSSSSSSSSGIPSPWRATPSPTNYDNDCPPSIIHTKSPAATKGMTMKPARKAKLAKKKCLTNSNRTINKKDDMPCTAMSTISSLSRSNTTKEPPDAKENKEPKGAKPTVRRRKRGQWGCNKKKGAPNTTSDSSVTSAIAIANTKTKSADIDTAKHYHCYLLRSLDPNHPLTTYIGFTTHPQRRIRQHNGILKNAGARKTKRTGRPWTFVCVVHGFQDKITALQFEWAWQHPGKSLAFREAVGDPLAGKMKRRYGPKARLDELRVLVRECLPFCLYSLTIYFPEKEYHDLYSGILRRGKDGNPYKKSDDASEAYEPLTNFEVCSLENMPVATEVAAAKKKKVAKREAKKTAGKNQSPTTEMKSYGSDVSEWLENAKNCLSDLGDDDDDGDDDSESECTDLNTIAEDDDSSSVDLCENGTDNDDENSAAAMQSMKEKALVLDKPSEPHHDHKDVGGMSKDFLSLSIDVSRRRHGLTDNTEGCNCSTISSADSTSQCSVGECDVHVVATNVPQQTEEENQKPPSNCASHYSPKGKVGKNTTANMCDIVDLCDSP